MLKVAHEAEEQLGGLLMQWWAGDGVARVLAYEAPALLLERVQGPRSLVAMVHDGRDDDATRILCDVAARLHAPRPAPLPDLLPLARWFEALEPAAARHGGVLLQSAAAMRELFSSARDVVALHGDLHHENVLDGGERGWLAIDPKRLVGERGYDFANIVCNPERDFDLVTSPGRLLRQVSVIATAAPIDRLRLLRWILAYAGLSAAWILEDGDRPELELAVASIIDTELRNGAT